MAARTLKDVADALKMDVELVRRILSEEPGERFSRETLDRVFGTARKLGYDFKKLKIGKRMAIRREVFDEVLAQVESHPSWGRSDIVKYIRQSSDMIERVHKRSFREELGLDR
ncbi:MAG: hypothetical protein HUU15_02550 [Candidatus Brocadiae bacterium]|nr:hypothetical protein [Candidatus Brocadiia bacterium]